MLYHYAKVQYSTVPGIMSLSEVNFWHKIIENGIKIIQLLMDQISVEISCAATL